MNLLFVCSKNKWRSRTAEEIFKNSQSHRVRSAGVDSDAVVCLNERMLDWADIIFVMEKKHKEVIRSKFQAASDRSRIIVLDIPDEYKFMDEDLVLSLKNGVASYVDDI